VNHDEYIFPARTVADSGAGLSYSVYCVSAVTSTPSVSYVSAPDSGYSLDNLAPAAPGGFTVAYNSGGGNYLSWDPSAASDFHYFTVYRGDSADFAPDPLNAVHHPTGTDWLDTVAQGWRYHYKISATDDAGNESDASSPGVLTAAEESGPPRDFALHQNVPNPFNPVTAIAFDVPVRTRVKLAIYDVSGRLIRTIVDREMAPGYKRVSWDGKDESGRDAASGVYFYRLFMPGFIQSRKMILVR